jgi:hypothetical protein
MTARIQLRRADGSVFDFYVPSAKQNVFHLAAEPNVLYGGAAGGGKSHAIRMDAYMRCMSQPGYRALLLRRTWRELETTHIERVIAEAPQLGATYYKSEYRLRFPNGSVIEFGHVEDDRALSQYLSTEYDAIYFDELVSFTERQFKFIASRARSTKPGVRPVIRAGTNPGGANSEWVKRYFITKDVDPERDPDYNPDDYRYIPATLRDNPYIDKSYESRLRALPSEALRRAYLEGDWNCFEGQYFTEFRPQDDYGNPWHVVDELPTIDGRPVDELPWIEQFRALDWGYRDPGVCGWYAVLPDGRIIKTQEYVFKEQTPSQVAREIKARTHGRVRYTVADPKIFTHDVGESIAETLARNGVPCLRADNDRINGWARLHEWLVSTTVGGGDRSIPMLQFCAATCPYSIRTIPAMVVDDHKPEDLRTKGTEDHAADETRYAVMSRPPLRSSREKYKPRKKSFPPNSMGWEINRILRRENRRRRLGEESVRSR